MIRADRPQAREKRRSWRALAFAAALLCLAGCGREQAAPKPQTGGSRPAAESFRAFRGRDPSIEALLRHSGLAQA